MCHSTGRSSLFNIEPGHQGARAEKPVQIGQIKIIFGMVIVLPLHVHKIMGTGSAFHHNVPAMEQEIGSV